ncbi:hypothetical protein RSK20926_15471 [Roseobacter sp. SK209-2-6]|uniref:hypothetical protein n=1 Tax=Roseobacter sp. SK209-2-6 TaxID=388739 RepID=UPI0000F3EF8D|nr:hypothetical protein [Roseobacter sp. SK209-2-6]EBA15630.1 hypothetical protein RSK20926_15471 [Roseobacter sp. SK209-2-6]
MLITAIVAAALRPIADKIDQQWAYTVVVIVGLAAATGVVWVATNSLPTSSSGYVRGTGIVEY